jgi:hypothetical protein
VVLSVLLQAAHGDAGARSELGDEVQREEDERDVDEADAVAWPELIGDVEFRYAPAASCRRD